MCAMSRSVIWCFLRNVFQACVHGLLVLRQRCPGMYVSFDASSAPFSSMCQVFECIDFLQMSVLTIETPTSHRASLTGASLWPDVGMQSPRDQFLRNHHRWHAHWRQDVSKHVSCTTIIIITIVILTIIIIIIIIITIVIIITVIAISSSSQPSPPPYITKHHDI